MKSRIRVFLFLSVLLLAALACNFPAVSTPTPFIFPTPDLTMTAIFNPTQAINPNIPPTLAPAATNTPLPTTIAGPVTAAPTLVLPTAPPTATPTFSLPTAAPTSTPAATEIVEGPEARPKYSVSATYFSDPPDLDGVFDEWGLEKYPIDNVVYGAGSWKNENDLSATAMLGWDEDNLYLAVNVQDNAYVQNATGENIYKGDSLEVLLDTDVSGDYYSDVLNGDDYQLGISPGSPNPGDDPEAYLWFPESKEGPRPKVKIGVNSVETGYHVEAAIPWSLFQVDPSKGDHYGFALSVSDNDNPDQNVQQSMVSNDPNRSLSDPTTWGDLELVKP
jgi:hypothetical protein